MSVAQPRFLLIFNETSGSSITNYGSEGGNYAIQQGTSPTNYEWAQQAATPTGGRLDLKTKTGANMPYMTTAAASQADTLVGMNFACGFSFDSLGSAPGSYLISEPSGVGTEVRIVTPSAGGDFDLACKFHHSGAAGVTHTFTALSFATFYQVAMAFDPTTVAATVARFKLGAAATVTPSSVDASTFALPTGNPSINREFSFTTYGGCDGQIYYWAYGRGTSWSSTDLGDINTDPSAAITGWPGGGGGSSIAAISSFYRMIGVR